METENGLRRCTCPRGTSLIEAAKPNAPKPPVLSEEACVIFTGMMSGGMQFFPSDSAGRAAIGNEIRSMCANNGEADWLVTRMNRLFTKWPGIQELRRVFCASKSPLDAIAAIGESEVYPNNNFSLESRSESNNNLLTVAEMRRISGVAAPVDFPRDATDLLAESLKRRRAVAAAPLPTDQETADIIARQNANRKESA